MAFDLMEKTKAERENNKEKKKWTSTEPHVVFSLITSLGVLIVKLRKSIPTTQLVLNVLLRFQKIVTEKKLGTIFLREKKKLNPEFVVGTYNDVVWMCRQQAIQPKKNLRSIYSRKVDWLPSFFFP